MLCALTTVALALVAAAGAKPLAAAAGGLGDPVTSSGLVDVSGSVPVIDLGSVAATPNVTLGDKGAPVDVTADPYPASIYLCESTSCTSCHAYDLSTILHDVCLVFPFEFRSFIITQESGEGLPFDVFVGTSCPAVNQIPRVNSCYYVNTPFRSLLLEP